MGLRWLLGSIFIWDRQLLPRDGRIKYAAVTRRMNLSGIDKTWKHSKFSGMCVLCVCVCVHAYQKHCRKATREFLSTWTTCCWVSILLQLKAHPMEYFFCPFARSDCLFWKKTKVPPIIVTKTNYFPYFPPFNEILVQFVTSKNQFIPSIENKFIIKGFMVKIHVIDRDWICETPKTRHCPFNINLFSFQQQVTLC